MIRKGISYVQTDVFNSIIPVLMNNTLRFLKIFSFRLRRPPVDEISRFIELSALIVKPMRYFMANHETNSAVIHIPGPIIVEESTLQDTSGKFYEQQVPSSFSMLIYNRTSA